MTPKQKEDSLAWETEQAARLNLTLDQFRFRMKIAKYTTLAVVVFFFGFIIFMWASEDPHEKWLREYRDRQIHDARQRADIDAIEHQYDK
jgi:hypothetical protein